MAIGYIQDDGEIIVSLDDVNLHYYSHFLRHAEEALDDRVHHAMRHYPGEASYGHGRSAYHVTKGGKFELLRDRSTSLREESFDSNQFIDVGERVEYVICKLCRWRGRPTNECGQVRANINAYKERLSTAQNEKADTPDAELDRISEIDHYKEVIKRYEDDLSNHVLDSKYYVPCISLNSSNSIDSFIESRVNI